MSTNLPVISDWSQLRSMDSLPSRIVWERDGKEMALVPAGAFTMGISEADARRLAEDTSYIEGYLLSSTPQRQVSLDAYYIDVTPVTHGDYARFLAANPEHRVPFVEEPWAGPYKWDKEKRRPPGELMQHPVVLVNWEDAEAYADWAGKTLPKEAQWEKAARGTDGRAFPWGDQWDASRLNVVQSIADSSVTSFPEWQAWWVESDRSSKANTTPVGAYPEGASPYGVQDMAGNVFEICAGRFEAYPGSQVELPEFDGTCHVIRSGSFDSIPLWQYTWYRLMYPIPNLLPDRVDGVGFRCASAPF